MAAGPGRKAAAAAASAALAGGQGRTHALLVQALPPHEHLHVLVEGEGPVVLAEAVQQLGILVVRVLVAHWKKERRAGT